jgi:hypothetical protein
MRSAQAPLSLKLEPPMLNYFAFFPASPLTARGETQPVFDWPGMMKASAPTPDWTPQEAFASGRPHNR